MIIFVFVFFPLTIPEVAYQPHSTMTVSTATFMADVDSWLRRVGRMGILLLPLHPLYSFTYRYVLPSSSHYCLYH